jgi:cobalt/nickel transport system permease protein
MLIGMLLQRVIYRYQQMEIALEMKLFQGEFYS